MTAVRVKALIASVLMVSALAAGHAMKPTRHMAAERPKMDLELAFPKAFGDWQVDTRVPVQLIAPDLQAFLDKRPASFQGR